MAEPGRGDPPDAEVDRRFAEIVGRFYENDSAGAEGGADGLDAAEPNTSESTGRARLPRPFTADPVKGFPEATEPERPGEPARPGAQPGPADFGALFDFNEPAEPDPGPDTDRYVPEVTPMPRLSTPALIGTLLLIGSITVCLLSVLGVHFPAWVGWVTVAAFAGGLVLLLSRLPRHRDPRDGDGAVL